MRLIAASAIGGIFASDIIQLSAVILKKNMEIDSMIEYIEREAAIESIMSEPQDAHYPHWYAVKIKSIPAVDVAPVRHGRWVRPHWKNSSYCCDCSECGGEAMHRDYQWYKNGIYRICPNCGAKMDGE